MDLTKLLLHIVNFLIQFTLATCWYFVLQLISVSGQLDNLLLTMHKLDLHVLDQLVEVLVTLLRIGVSQLTFDVRKFARGFLST